MSFLRSILNFFAVKQPEGDELRFDNLDAEKLAVEVGVKPKAVERASLEQPDSSSTTIDSVEHEIEARIYGEARSCSDKCFRTLNGLKAGVQNIHLAGELQKVSALDSGFEQRFKTRVAEAKQDLKLAKEELKTASQEVLDFKARNRLHRSVNHPESVIFRWAILFILVLIESVLNGFFFAEGSDLGLLGGLLEALIISIINIFFAFLAGTYLLPNFSHINRFRKVTSICFFFVYVILAVTAALFVAHYRDAFVIDPDKAASVAQQNFLAGPLEFAVANSWMFFLLTVLFAILAVVDAFKINDPYAGYSSVVRRQDRAQSDLMDDQERVRRELLDLEVSVMKELDELVEEAKYKQESLTHYTNSRDRVLRLFTKQIEQYVDVGEYLIKLYRDTNRAHRSTEAPAYFNETWKPDSERLFEMDHRAGNLEDFNKELEEIAQIETKVGEIRDKFQQNYRATLAELEED